ncbi:hypothetical protein BREVNS_1431 [Brevinematales bacterium NS]|nr:hypothetical protein BREVNS_1431 [Brevinematales bacterium NS]
MDFVFESPSSQNLFFLLYVHSLSRKFLIFLPVFPWTPTTKNLRPLHGCFLALSRSGATPLFPTFSVYKIYLSFLSKK